MLIKSLLVILTYYLPRQSVSSQLISSMKKFILLAVVFVFGAIAQLSAQCVPDTTIKIPGFYPAQFPEGYVNQPYSATSTILSITDTTVFGQKVVIDSMVLNDVIGLPAGINHACLNNTCVFLPKVHSCVLFSGTPIESGTFPLKMAVKIYAKILGTMPYTRVDTIKSFSITVQAPNSIQSLEKASYFIQPTIVDNQVNIISAVTVQPQYAIKNLNEVVVFDATGKKVMMEFVKENFGFSADVTGLTAGVYWVRMGEFSGKFIKK
jgi:hypothetical protein